MTNKEAIARIKEHMLIHKMNEPRAIYISEALDMAIKALEKEPRKGHWIDYSDEGFVECSECGSATNCDGNIADLHFCFSCGAKMIEPQESEE